MEKKYELVKAFKIGSISIFAYLVSYYMRNILSVSTPGMLETGLFTKEVLGTLSSVYFFLYAVGQLINGVIGDKVKPKLMVLFGLLICGTASIAFAFSRGMIVWLVLFGVMGFSLSMLRGPLVKTISENTLPQYARICCVFFSFASFAGPLIASLFAMIFNWRYTFVFSGLSGIIIAICSYVALTSMEKKGVIVSKTTKKINKKKNVWSVFRLENFVFYMFIGALIEISAASINFWLPTYLTERLDFHKDVANGIFSAMTLVRSFVPFVALIILKWFKGDDVRMVKYSFISATMLFTGVLLLHNPYVNVVLFLLALMSVSCASALLWSVYIPSQGKSGMVSTVNGVLDFAGYAAASLANIIFSFTIDIIGWNGIVVLWIVLMASGVVAAFFTKKTTTVFE